MPQAAAAELAVLGLSTPAAGPASAGVAPPEVLSDEVVEEHARDEEGLRMNPGESQVYGAYPGEAFLANLVKQARAEDVSKMDTWGV